MKKISLVLFFIGVITGLLAQDGLPVNDKTGKITFQEVVDSKGLSNQKVYEITKEWGTKQGWTITEDVAGQKIKFSGTIEVISAAPDGKSKQKGTVSFTFFVAFKDGKYKIVMTEFTHKGEKKGTDGGKLEASAAACGPKVISSKGWVSIKRNTNKQSTAIVEDLKRVVKEVQNDPESSDDW
ncbi:DUF4468 domain-containing protein [Cyclobacteriaceae bacterium]|nr:DUF4468 domain-containing protein [Cyclobacteriaceae bacterium]